jgi:acyl-coenzyme A synthetase/AMP-(fatty) acid ligase
MPLEGPALSSPVQVATLLQAAAETRPDEVALVSAESSWTWRELDRASACYAGNLLALGVRPGDRVASLMPNRGALLVHYLACLRAGFVAAPLNYRYMPPEIDHALEVSGASILIAHAERERDLAATARVPRLARGVIRYGGASDTHAKLEELFAREPHRTELCGPAPCDPAFIYFTSGSTGKPKGVCHSAETFGWMLASAIQTLAITADDVVLPGASISHVAGSTLSLAGLGAGARVVLARAFDGDELLPLLRAHRPTVFVMLPAALITLIREHRATRDDFRSVRLCISGGDKVAAELEREFTDLTGFAIDENYGMSEVGFATLNPVGGLNKPGSVGTASAGFQLSVRGDDGTELPVGQEGRLWVRSRSVMVGYWDHPAATAETIVDGWLDTGDVMQADADGYLWFRGRRKQIIVHDGSNICPQEIEEALLEHPAVDGAGVIGVHDLVHGENVRAYITLAQGVAPPRAQQLIEFARARVGYKAPETIEVLAEMPVNATGKVDRVALKRLAETAQDVGS